MCVRRRRARRGGGAAGLLSRRRRLVGLQRRSIVASPAVSPSPVLHACVGAGAALGEDDQYNASLTSGSSLVGYKNQPAVDDAKLWHLYTLAKTSGWAAHVTPGEEYLKYETGFY